MKVRWNNINTWSHILVLFLIVFLFACKGGGQEKLIEGKWYAVHLENPAMDSFFRKSQEYIDTMGKGHDDATNLQIYGVANMDSVRRAMQVQHDSAKQMQDDAVTRTIFTFMKGGIAEITMAGITDSCKWLLDNDNGLIFEELGAGHNQAVSRYHIVELSENELKLRFYEEGDSSTVTFNHQGK